MPTRAHLFDLALGVAWAVVGWQSFADPMTFALWSLVGVVAVLPLTLSRGHAIACVPIVVSVAFTGGGRAALVVTAVASSLPGGVALLRAIRVPAEVAIVAMMTQAILLLTWPLWAARLLLRFDSQRLVDWAVWLGPVFAINRAIDPTDAITHRPGAYEWMNLGQDVPYALPTTVWPCVALHASIGIVGLLAVQLRRNTNRHESSGSHSEMAS